MILKNKKLFIIALLFIKPFQINSIDAFAPVIQPSYNIGSSSSFSIWYSIKNLIKTVACASCQVSSAANLTGNDAGNTIDASASLYTTMKIFNIISEPSGAIASFFNKIESYLMPINFVSGIAQQVLSDSTNKQIQEFKKQNCWKLSTVLAAYVIYKLLENKQPDQKSIIYKTMAAYQPLQLLLLYLSLFDQLPKETKWNFYRHLPNCIKYANLKIKNNLWWIKPIALAGYLYHKVNKEN